MLDKQHKYYLSRIYKKLADYDCEFLIGLINIKGPDGERSPVDGFSTGGQVVIDPRGELLPTVIHECLHECYRSWDHDHLIKVEETLTKHMSPKQWQTLLLKFNC